MDTILIVDDEERIRTVLGAFLEDRGFRVEEADCGERVLGVAREAEPEVILMDLSMPGMDGIETMTQIGRVLPQSKTIIMTAYGSIESAVDAMKRGAYDYITKPLRNEDLLIRIQRALETIRLERKVEVLEDQLVEKYGFEHIVGQSGAMDAVFGMAQKVAARDVTVFLTGESGTGKELIARAMHRHSPRKDRPFVPINCGAIPENLIENEFFGHEKGAYTDAKERKIGKFEQAEGGALFLDEVCELPLSAQTKLLRAIQEKEITRIGGQGTIPVDVRIICATNRDPWKRVQEGTFREDLYYRLNVFPIHVPPLRERPEDIAPLVDHFVGRFNALLRTSVAGVSDEAMALLRDCDWPGNVRELENTLQHAVLMADEGYIKKEDLPPRVRGASDDLAGGEEPSLGKILENVERRTIRRVLHEEHGNRTRTAQRLRISRQTLLTKIEAYGLRAP